MSLSKATAALRLLLAFIALMAFVKANEAELEDNNLQQQRYIVIKPTSRDPGERLHVFGLHGLCQLCLFISKWKSLGTRLWNLIQTMLENQRGKRTKGGATAESDSSKLSISFWRPFFHYAYVLLERRPERQVFYTTRFGKRNNRVDDLGSDDGLSGANSLQMLTKGKKSLFDWIQTVTKTALYDLFSDLVHINGTAGTRDLAHTSFSWCTLC